MSPVALLGVLMLSAPSPAAPTLRLNHRLHLKPSLGMGCTDCHPAEAADRVRPAQDGHQACDAAACHAKDFYGQTESSERLCLLCHTHSDHRAPDNPLRPFPSLKAAAAGRAADAYEDHLAFYVEFNHKLHLGDRRARRKLGAKDPCAFCHRVDPVSLDLLPTDHELCAECHATSEKVPMDACDRCHVYRRTAQGRLRSTGPALRARSGRVTGRFRHETHRFDRRFARPKSVSCGQCHRNNDRAESLGSIQLLQGSDTMVSACGQCHRRGERTAKGKAMFTTTGRCTNCHLSSFINGDAPPRSHGGRSR